MPPRLLIVSLGNPSPYLNTLHSAGHTLLRSIAVHLSLPAPSPLKTSLPTLSTSAARSAAATSCPQRSWTLYRAASNMNVVGPEVLKLWRAFKANHADGEARLVLLHDELESTLGKVKVVDRVGGSARGHNGLKDVFKRLPEERIVRVGIGIGRPASRESEDVSRWVLRKETSEEREAIEGAAKEVVERLERIT